MKKGIAVTIACILNTIIYAQTVKTLNIQNAAFTYNDQTKKFVLSGITRALVQGEPEYRDGIPQEASLKVLIETGDGNYIHDNITYDELGSGMFTLPRGTTFEYKDAGEYDVYATLVKTYDKGGPRTRTLEMRDFSPPNPNRDANNQLVYPNGPGGVTVSVFDNTLVPGDTITGVITIVNMTTPRMLTLHADRSILISENLRIANGIGYTGSRVNDKVVMQVSNNAGLSVVNLFFDISLPSNYNVETSPDRLIFGLDSVANLSVARSHDPNRLWMLRTCSSLTTRKFTFFVDVENTGWATEKYVEIGLKFPTSQFNVNSFIVSSVKFQGVDRDYTPHAGGSSRALRAKLGNSQIALTFTNAELEGLNVLPTGHPKTRARIIFTMKLKNTVAVTSTVPIQAFIFFGNANELTPTKVVMLRLQDLNRICHLCQNPSPAPCHACKDPVLRRTWLCQ